MQVRIKLDFSHLIIYLSTVFSGDSMSINHYIDIPLGITAHEMAVQHATKHQDNLSKAKQIYLNSLAIYSVHRYCQWHQIPTNLEAGHSWDILERGNRNVADLVLPNIGKLECRPIPMGNEFINNKNLYKIPSQLLDEERVAYVMVGFDERLDYGHLLGFKAFMPNGQLQTEIKLDKLSDMEDFFSFLRRIELEFNLDKPIDVNALQNGQLPDSVIQSGWLKPRPLSKIYSPSSGAYRSRQIAESHRPSQVAENYLYRLVENIRKNIKNEHSVIVPDDPQLTSHQLKQDDRSSCTAIVTAWKSKEDSESLSDVKKTVHSKNWFLLVIIDGGQKKTLPPKSSVEIVNLKTFEVVARAGLSKRGKSLYAFAEAPLPEALSIRVRMNGKVSMEKLPPFYFREE